MSPACLPSTRLLSACTSATTVSGWLARLARAWETTSFEYEEFIDAGEQVIVVLSQRARGRASGVEVEFSYAQAWTAGRLVRMEFFPTRAEAFAALGLGE